MHPPTLTTLAHQISLKYLLTLVGSGYLVYYILTFYLHRNKFTLLRGPPTKSYLFGVRRHIDNAPDPGEVYERWAEEYGSVYRIPDSMRTSIVVVTDPKAIAHFYTKDTFGYEQTRLMKTLMDNMIGRGLLWAEGEAHHRQRKALSPAFTNAAIRKITPVFFDSAYELKSQWDNMIDSSGASHTIIEVQQWMNRISLDSIGNAGFSHPFNTLSNPSSVSPFQLAFNPSLASLIAFLLARTFPVALKAPTTIGRLMSRVKETTGEIGEGLLTRTRMEGDKAEEKSIMGLLIKTEDANTMTKEEVIAQVSVLLVAGYETTSITLTWALIELSKNPTTQDHLRAELLRHFPTGDPSWEQLTNADALPYLDAVVHEVLRLHPPGPETIRVATEDDILPLSTPLRASSGSLINSIHIRKGTFVTIPIRCINRSAVIWGEESKVFKPERWLEGSGGGGDDGRWQEVSGHRHLLTFADGPRACLGKGFALAEIKAVLVVLVRNYSFAFPGEKGVNTEIESVKGFLVRPKITGEEGVGACVSLRVGRIE